MQSTPLELIYEEENEKNAKPPQPAIVPCVPSDQTEKSPQTPSIHYFLEKAKVRNERRNVTDDMIRQLRRVTQVKAAMKKRSAHQRFTNLLVIGERTHTRQEQHQNQKQSQPEAYSLSEQLEKYETEVNKSASSHKRPVELTSLDTSSIPSKRHCSESESAAETSLASAAQERTPDSTTARTLQDSFKRCSDNALVTKRTCKGISPALREVHCHKQVAAARRHLSEEKETNEKTMNSAQQRLRRKTVAHPILEALVQHNRRTHSLPSSDGWRSATLVPFKPTPTPTPLFTNTRSSAKSRRCLVPLKLQTSPVKESNNSSSPSPQLHTPTSPQLKAVPAAGTSDNPVELPSESESDESKGVEGEPEHGENSESSGEPSGPATRPSSPVSVPTLSSSPLMQMSVVPLLTISEAEVPPLKRSLSHGALVSLRLIAFQAPNQSVLLPLTSQHSYFRLLNTCFRFRIGPFGTPEEVALCNVQYIKYWSGPPSVFLLLPKSLLAAYECDPRATEPAKQHLVFVFDRPLNTEEVQKIQKNVNFLSMVSKDEVLCAVRDCALLRSVEERRHEEERKRQMTKNIRDALKATQKEQKKTVSEIGRKNEVLLVYPPHARDALVITRDDVTRLAPTQFLNDTLIDFYLRYLHTELIPLAQRTRFHFFNSFFYKTLSRGGYARVKNWTKHIDIFSFDFLLIPIITNFHWRLAIVYYPGAVATPNTNSTIRTSKPQPEVNNKSSNNSNSTNTSANANVDAVNDKRSAVEQKDGTEMKVSTKEKALPQVCSPGICVLDSLHGSATRVVTLLKSYLRQEWQARKGGEYDVNKLQYYRVVPPVQNNHCDCGVFILHYAELFCLTTPAPFKITTSWFDSAVIEKKRVDIERLIWRLTASSWARSKMLSL
jgi:hypothetical protein